MVSIKSSLRGSVRGYTDGGWGAQDTEGEDYNTRAVSVVVHRSKGQGLREREVPVETEKSSFILLNSILLACGYCKGGVALDGKEVRLP